MERKETTRPASFGPWIMKTWQFSAMAEIFWKAEENVGGKKNKIKTYRNTGEVLLVEKHDVRIKGH